MYLFSNYAAFYLTVDHHAIDVASYFLGDHHAIAQTSILIAAAAFGIAFGVIRCGPLQPVALPIGIGAVLALMYVAIKQGVTGLANGFDTGTSLSFWLAAGTSVPIIYGFGIMMCWWEFPRMERNRK